MVQMISYKESCKQLNLTQKEARLRIELSKSNIFERRLINYYPNFFQYYFQEVDRKIAVWILVNCISKDANLKKGFN